MDQIAVTALAPSSDCRTFAIGYKNGSLFAATLQPRFTILHNLTTSRGPADDPAKVVRNLGKAEIAMDGPNWMGWPKNGHIVQYSDSQAQSWDVRTKHVTHDPIPTLDLVRGLAVYGPGATLFTLGPNNTVQQFDLNSLAIMGRHCPTPSKPIATLASSLRRKW
ncbi:hypothetical protein IL306_010460 [Fusarium sp. DS 682]|nr:hypothetical protein IL306_010460 [Fusarium sp. DS 682]